jgi:hypothetical protein
MKSYPLSFALLALAAGIASGYFLRGEISGGAAEGRQKGPHPPNSRFGAAPSDGKREGGKSRETDIFSVFEHIATLTPAELEVTIQKIRQNTVQGEISSVLQQNVLLHALGSLDPLRGLRLAREFDLRGDGSATALVLSAYAAKDPAGAAAMIQTGNGLSPDPRASLSAESVATVWARQDPAAAKQWVRGLPECIQSRPWEAVATVLAGADPDAAVEFVLAMPTDADRAHGCAKVAEIWARSTPDAALAWATSLGSESRRVALPAVIHSLAERDPSSAAAWLLRQPPESHLPQNSAALIGVWVRRDPAAAAEWVRGLPPGPLQTESIQHLVYEWTSSDPERASAWLHDLPEGGARDEAAAMLSLQTTASDPEAAAVWAASISDPVRRAAELQRTFSAWRRQDYDAATHWMQYTEPGIR